MNDTIGTPLSTPIRLAPTPSWKTATDDAVGGADGQQVEDRRHERDPQRAERGDQQQHRQADDDGDEQRQARGDLVGEVLEARRLAADVDLQRRVGRRLRDHVLAQALEQVARLRVLRRGLRDRDDRRHLAVLARRRGRDGGHARRRGDGLLERGELLLGAGVALRRVDGEQERAVGAGAERLAELVVGDALGARRRLVAVVGLAEAQLGDRRGEHEQHEHAGGDRQPRARRDARPSGRTPSTARRARPSSASGASRAPRS